MIFIPGHKNKWGEVESEFLAVLSDGRPHPVKHFYYSEANPASHNSYDSAKKTIRRIRQKIEGTGYIIVTTVKNNRTYWQLVRQISQDDL